MSAPGGGDNPTGNGPKQNDAAEAHRRAKEKQAAKRQITTTREQVGQILPSTAALSADDNFKQGRETQSEGLGVTLATPAFQFGASDQPQRSSIQTPRQGDGHLCLDSKNAKKRNFLSISADGRQTVMQDQYTATPQHVNAASAVKHAILGRLTERSVVHEHIMIEHNGININQSNRLRPGTTLCDSKRLKMQLDRVEKITTPVEGHCALCGRPGHHIRDCWGGPDRAGYIPRCPCNGKNHYPNECVLLRGWDMWTLFQTMFLSRINLPPFKHEKSWLWYVANNEEFHGYFRMWHCAVQHIACGSSSTACYNPLTIDTVKLIWAESKPWYSTIMTTRNLKNDGSTASIRSTRRRIGRQNSWFQKPTPSVRTSLEPSGP